MVNKFNYCLMYNTYKDYLIYYEYVKKYSTIIFLKK